MKLVTFEDSSRQSRIGAVSNDGRIADLHLACALYLRDVESENAFYRLADALVPPNMRALFRGGDTSLEAAHKAFDYAMHQDEHATGPRGETIFYAVDEIALKSHAVGFSNNAPWVWGRSRSANFSSKMAWLLRPTRLPLLLPANRHCYPKPNVSFISSWLVLRVTSNFSIISRN